MRWLKLHPRGVERMGIRFDYEGDELILLWKGLWQGGMWLSIGFEGRFASLAALDQMWADYFEAAISDEADVQGNLTSTSEKGN